MITIDELKDKLDNKARLIGLDIGTKYIGIAICDDRRKIATPFKTLDYINMSRLTADLKDIIEENNIKGIIVGYPINMDGTIGPKAQSSNSLADNLNKDTDLPILLWDERLSTAVVEKMLISADISRNKRKKNIDKLAASYILQGFLDLSLKLKES